MTVSGEALFISSKKGEKNEKAWFMAKFLDDANDEFFSAFVSEALFQELQGMDKKTPVILTLNLVPGQKYFSVESVEFIL